MVPACFSFRAFCFAGHGNIGIPFLCSFFLFLTNFLKLLKLEHLALSCLVHIIWIFSFLMYVIHSLEVIAIIYSVIEFPVYITLFSCSRLVIYQRILNRFYNTKVRVILIPLLEFLFFALMLEEAKYFILSSLWSRFVSILVWKKSLISFIIHSK